jgi:MFS family permease
MRTATTVGDAVPTEIATAPLERVVDRAVRRQVPLLFAALGVVYACVAGPALVQPELQRDIALTPAAFGIGSTALLLGFLLFAVPSNLLMERIGARANIGRVLACMGLGTAALAVVASPAQYVVVRFATGVLAAGLSPGLKLYVAAWYPATRRARVFALLVLAPALAGALLGGLTGALLVAMDGVAGLHAWQWLFVTLAAACLVVGAVVGLLLDDRPSAARWLSPEQRTELERALAAAHVDAPPAATAPRRVLASATFARLAATASCVGLASGTATYAVPLALRRLGHDPAAVSALSSIPYFVGGLAAFVWGRRSDLAGERKRHFAVACAAAAAGFALLAFAPNLAVGTAAATLASVGVLSVVAVYWPVPLARLTPATLALGIGVLQIANDLGTALAPTVHGVVLQRYGALEASLCATAALLVAAAFVLPGRFGTRPR